MVTVSSVEKSESIKSFKSAISKSEKALARMIQTGANTTMLKNRLQALHVGLAQLEFLWDQKPHQYTQLEIDESRRVLTDLIPGMEKIYDKLKSPSPQRTLLARRIKAIKLALNSHN
jgi:hypothetical protein